MKPLRSLVVAAAAAGLLRAAAAEAEPSPWRASVWLVTPTVADQPALLLGLGRQVPVNETWNGGGLLRAGIVDYGGGNRYLELDGELRLTRSFGRLDEVGVGGRFEYWGDVNYDLGPMLLLALEEPVYGPDYSLYGEVSWMPFGLLGDYDAEHMNFELGVALAGERWSGRLGYRRKFYYGLEQDLEYGGPVLAVALAWE